MRVLVDSVIYDDIETWLTTHKLDRWWTNLEVATVLDELHRTGRSWCSDGPIVAVD